jgi:hypothetical protein
MKRETSNFLSQNVNVRIGCHLINAEFCFKLKLI